MVEEQITITKSDLQQLIREGVAQAMTASHERTPQMLFQGVAIDFNDIEVINHRYGLKTSALNDSCIYSRNQSKDWMGRVCDSGPGKNEVHDLLRKIAMAVSGERKNSKVARSDFNRVRNDYDQFRDLFLKLYDERCADLVAKQETKNHD